MRYWNDNGSPILDEEGKPRKWVGGISDITDRKRAEEALVQAQRLSAIGELASGVAHDFNNSLQGIFGNIEVALLEDISPEMRNYLETIKESATDAASRIQQLQRFAGKEKKQNDYELKFRTSEMA
jgi:signal transduction histidine kinase